VDLGALVMSDEDEQEDGTRFQMDAAQHPSGDEDRDFAEILGMFRQKVSENIHPQDSSSHYDLGLAFKEMGLFDDAIAQLQHALRAGSNPVATLEVLGECFIEKGEHSLAVRVLSRAVRIPEAAESDLVGVLYWLGRTEEVLERPDEARGFYERVIAVDIGFRDAAERLESLRGGSASST
jgi:tetratricopeptide (TPR) repeat protein